MAWSGLDLKSFAAGFVGAFSVQAIASAARQTSAWADALSEASDRLGIGVEQLQRLQCAGELTNVSQQQLTTSLEQFGRRLGDAARGQGDLADALKRSGIELRNQDGSLRSISDVFEEYARAVGNAGTEQEALALAAAGFGRGSAVMVTTLRQMQDEMRSFGVLTEQQIETLGRYDGPRPGLLFPRNPDDLFLAKPALANRPSPR